MSILYTRRGLPVVSQGGPVSDGVFESHEVDELYKARNQQNTPSFDEELCQIVEASKVWQTTGGLFAAALDPQTVLTPSAQSFIAETAMLLTGGIKRRRIGFHDWGLILLPSDKVIAVKPTFSKEELEALNALSSLKIEALVQQWVSKFGVDDFIRTLYIYVSPLEA